MAKWTSVAFIASSTVLCTIGVSATSQESSSVAVTVETIPSVADQMGTLGGNTMALLLDASGLKAALSDCGADGTNSGLPSYTVFVPREAAVTAALATLNLSVGEIAAQPALVKQLLLYHVHKGSISPNQLLNPSNTILQSMGGLTLAITKILDPLDVRINNYPIVLRDSNLSAVERLEALEACNGWSYQLDGFLAPASAIVTNPIQTGPEISTAKSLTRSSYVEFSVQFISEVKGVEPTDFTNAGTAPGCTFSVPPRATEWNSRYSVMVACQGPGTITPVFASGGASPRSGAAVPATAKSGQTATIVAGPLLTIDVKSPGTGTVTSNPAGIDCGTACIAEFPVNSMVSLSATPAAGHIFIGWSGACTGSQTCTIRANGAVQVTAEFVRAGQLSVATIGSGQGSVTSRPTGINCGTQCATILREGTSVTLTARAARGSRFVGWFGACSGQGTCTIKIASGSYQYFGVQDVYAAFEPW